MAVAIWLVIYRMRRVQRVLAVQEGQGPVTRNSRSSVRLLLVEDDAELAAELVAELLSLGYAVAHVDNGLDAVARADDEHFDLLIMDRMLPGLDGIAVIERLREENVRVPVLVLSALGAVDDRIRGLKAGGDDYLTKPFALGELAARVEALLRRPLETRDTVLAVGEVELDLIDRVAYRRGRRIELLPREFKLLEYLMRRSGQVVTRAMLLEDVWHYRFVPQTNLVDVHLGKLRRKLDGPGEAPVIESIRGSGFQFRADT
jgi:two-component system OmpR family response regulator